MAVDTTQDASDETPKTADISIKAPSPGSASTATPGTPVNGEAPQASSVVAASSSEAAEDETAGALTAPPPNTTACSRCDSPTEEPIVAQADPRVFHRRLSDAIETLQTTSDAIQARGAASDNQLEDAEVAALSDVASVLQEAACRIMTPNLELEDPVRAEARRAAATFCASITKAAIAANAAKVAGDALQSVVERVSLNLGGSSEGAALGDVISAAGDAAAALQLSEQVASKVTETRNS